MNDPKSSLLGGTLLVAGTAIGGGMLALPVLTAMGGFVPSLAIYALCWLFMASTGLLFLEVSLWLPEGANIVSMAEATLGRWGRLYSWSLYLFFFYCLTVAYMVGGGGFLGTLLPDSFPNWSGPLLFALLFSPIVTTGTWLVSPINGFLVGAMAVLYIAFITFGAPYIHWDYLTHVNWPLSLISLPVAFAAFGYQGIIPTLVTYFKRDVRKIRFAILVGSSIPLVVYIIWQALILGITPLEGNYGLISALKNGQNAVEPLVHFIDFPSLIWVGELFAFAALLTSFLGVTLGLMDFLADGLSLANHGWNKLLLALIVFVLPLTIAIFYPTIFLVALETAGGFGAALILGLLPVMMVWKGRERFSGTHQLKGGKPALLCLALFVLFEIACEMLLSFGYFRV